MVQTLKAKILLTIIAIVIPIANIGGFNVFCTQDDTLRTQYIQDTLKCNACPHHTDSVCATVMESILRGDAPPNIDSVYTHVNVEGLLDSNEALSQLRVRERDVYVRERVSEAELLEEQEAQDEQEEKKARRQWIAISNNFLYESVTALYDFNTVPVTVGAEFPIGKHWSAYAEYLVTAPWHAWNGNADCFELMHLNLGARWYPGGTFLHPFRSADESRLLSGWYAYASVGAGYYDFERAGKGYQGEEILGTVGLGYKIYFGKHLRLDLGAGVGPIYSQYRYYEGRSNNEHLMFQYRGTWSYFGPTDARVSLSWLF